MIVKDLIEALQKYPPETIVYTYDAEDNNLWPISGMLFNPMDPEVDHQPTLELHTDDNS